MNTKETIVEWLDAIFVKKIPAEVEAIYINLVESHELVEVEFYGIDKLDPSDIDWPCNYDFSAESIEVPFAGDIPQYWEKSLKDISTIIGEYVSSKAEKHRLSSIKRVGVGFGDSEIVIVKDEI